MEEDTHLESNKEPSSEIVEIFEIML